MTYYLIKFSNVFYTDINLYDKTGTLLATSRPEIFEQGLISEQMNPSAYNQIHIYKKSNFTHNESIGGLNYISTYVPFRNEKNVILAYMNLPYFAKQNELENELNEKSINKIGHASNANKLHRNIPALISFTGDSNFNENNNIITIVYNTM